MSDTPPLVSIIMPAYNAEKYIEEAIASVLTQTYKHWELIVINDGSIDNTRSKIETFKDTRIHFINQDNQGVSVARNRGLDVAKGEYITFLDSDDVLPKESLEVRVGFMEKNKHIDIVDGTILVKDKKMIETLRRYVPYYTGALLPKLLALDSSVFFNVCYMFRKNIVKNVSFKTHMTHAEDLLFYVQLAITSSATYGFVSKTVYHYRSGHASTMSDVSGLEAGYIQLLKEIKKDTKPYKWTFVLLKAKIMKIMFLSWYATSHKKQAFLCLHKIVFI